MAWVTGSDETESVWGLGCRPRIWTLSCGLWRASKGLFGKSETVNLFLEGTMGASPELVLPGAGRGRRLSLRARPTAFPPPHPPLDQVTPQGRSSSDSGVGIAMETSRSPHGDRPGKSPGASRVDLDPGYYPQSETVFFLPEPGFGPGEPYRPPGRALHSPLSC